MRPLRSCDFCDADALGTFDVVPPELEPTEAERRRAVLCRSCKQRLEVLLEPLVARASPTDGGVESGSAGPTAADASNQQPGPGPADGDGTDGSAAESTARDGPGRDPRSLEAVDPEAVDHDADEPGANGTEADEPGSIVASADESTEKRRRRRSPNASITAPEETTVPDETTGTETDEWRDEGDDPTERRVDSAREAAETEAIGERTGITFDEAAADESGAGDEADDGVTVPDDGRDGVPGADDPIGADDADGREPSTDDAESGDGDVPSASSDAGPTDESARSQPTIDQRTVAKVIRLLQNRDLPIDRAAAQELAASAYDLEDHEAEAIVDRTLERGEFLEQGGELHRA